MKKPSKKQQAALDYENERKLQAMDERFDKYHGKTFDAHVRWFDALTGSGMVRLEDGSSWYLSFRAIEGVDKNNLYPHKKDLLTLQALTGKKCKVRLWVSGSMVEHCTITE